MVRLKRIPAIRAANLLTLTMGVPYGILLAVATLLWSPWWRADVGLQVITLAWLTWAAALVTIWLFVAIACAVYNLLAGRLGGIEIEFTTLPPP